MAKYYLEPIQLSSRYLYRTHHLKWQYSPDKILPLKVFQSYTENKICFELHHPLAVELAEPVKFK